MGTKEIRIECLAEILEEIGVSATPEQVAKIAEDFALHLQMEHEMASYQHIGHKEKCLECEKLKRDLSGMVAERDAYHKSFCKTWKVESSDVMIDQGTVMIRR